MMLLTKSTDILSQTFTLADILVFCLFFLVALLAIGTIVAVACRLATVNKARKKALGDKSGSKRRVPYYGSIVNKDGEKIGKVKRAVCYDSDKNEMGKLVRDDDDIYLEDSGVRKGYLDKNDNLFTLENVYFATIKRNKLWLFALIIFLIIAVVVISALCAAFYTPKSEDYAPVLFIADEEGISWDDHENLPIFFNQKFGDTIIEPGLTGKYVFKIENRNKDEILYSLKFSCENEYGIKLLYRVKRDGAYVAGHDGYILPEDIDLEELTQQARSTSVFELEWKWEHDDSVDTIAGENGAMYTLHISYNAQVNKKETENK